MRSVAREETCRRVEGLVLAGHPLDLRLARPRGASGGGIEPHPACGHLLPFEAEKGILVAARGLTRRRSLGYAFRWREIVSHVPTRRPKEIMKRILVCGWMLLACLMLRAGLLEAFLCGGKRPISISATS